MGSFHCRLYLVSLIGVVFIILSGVFSSSAFAAGVTYDTVRVSPGRYAPNGIVTPVTVNVATDGVPRYQQVMPIANKAVIGRLARSVIKGGVAGVAITGVVEGLGYIIDQATGEIRKKITIPGEPTGGTSSPSHTCSGPNSATSAKTACYASTQYNIVVGSYYVGFNCPASHPYGSPTQALCYVSPGDDYVSEVPIDETDYPIIDNALDNQLSLQDKSKLVNDIIRDVSPRGSLDTSDYPVSLTGSYPDLVTLYEDYPNFRSALQAVINASIAFWEQQQDPTFELTPEQQEIIDTGTYQPPMVQDQIEVVVEIPEFEFPEFELPDFCTWASFVCAPFESTDQPPVPQLDLDTPDYDSGLPTSGTCPQPLQVATSFGTWEITFQFACDLAEAIRIPLTAIAYLMSAFIVVGVRK